MAPPHCLVRKCFGAAGVLGCKLHCCDLPHITHGMSHHPPPSCSQVVRGYEAVLMDFGSARPVPIQVASRADALAVQENAEVSKHAQERIFTGYRCMRSAEGAGAGWQVVQGDRWHGGHEQCTAWNAACGWAYGSHLQVAALWLVILCQSSLDTSNLSPTWTCWCVYNCACNSDGMCVSTHECSHMPLNP